jgi:hypothetical protein
MNVGAITPFMLEIFSGQDVAAAAAQVKFAAVNCVHLRVQLRGSQQSSK